MNLNYYKTPMPHIFGITMNIFSMGVRKTGCTHTSALYGACTDCPAKWAALIESSEYIEIIGRKK